MKSTNFPSKTQGSGVASLVPADASSAAFSADADVSLPKPFAGAGAGAGGGSPAPSLSAALTAFLALRSKISWVSRSSPWFGGWKTNLWGKYGRRGRRVGEWWDLNGILGKWWYDNGKIMRTWMRMIPSQKWIVVVGGAWGHFGWAKKGGENGAKFELWTRTGRIWELLKVLACKVMGWLCEEKFEIEDHHFRTLVALWYD